MKPSKRCLEFLNRCALAEHFTSPTKPMDPRITAEEIRNIADAGLAAWGKKGLFRLTAAGRAALKGHTFDPLTGKEIK